MGFKKKKLNKNNSFLTIVSVLIVFIIMGLGIITIGAVDNFMGESNYKVGSGVVKTDDKGEQYFKKDINVLIVGRGGYENDAPQLTDSIILAKINKETKSVSLLSIQRDLYVSYPLKDGHGKINSVYSYYYHKNNKDEKFAMGQLADKIKDITGEEVDYYVNIDFAGFRKIIDSIGGIEIDVKNSFTDREYPTANWGYQTISFKKGLQKMDGETALKYSRSRHGTSDFDRSLRQQQVLQAIKNKITSKEGFNEASLVDLFTSLMQNFTTDVSINDAVALTKDLGLLKENYKFYSSNFNDTCIDNGSCKKGGIIYVPRRDLFGGSWVSLVNGTTKTSLSKYDVSRLYSKIVLDYPKIEEEEYKISIYNGTKTSGVGVFVNGLKKFGFNTSFKDVSNAPESYEKTVIYFNGVDESSDTIKGLKELFKGEFIQLTEPKFQFNGKNLETDIPKAKIEIVIGKDYFQDKSIFNL